MPTRLEEVQLVTVIPVTPGDAEKNNEHASTERQRRPRKPGPTTRRLTHDHHITRRPPYSRPRDTRTSSVNADCGDVLQPADRYWLFKGIETAIFGGLAVALLALTV
jgi:hypothetical protein